MKIRTIHLTGMLVAVAAALAAFAPVASASSECGCGDSHRNGGRRAQAVARYDDHTYGRSYFYREVTTGRAHSHITALRPCYGCRGNGPVEKIDRRTGRLLAAYIWDGNSWEKTRRGDYAHDEGRGRDHGGYVAYED